MAEVYASNEVVAELLNPISGAVLLTVTFREDITTSERPVYVDRAYSRSGAVSSRRLRSRGSITLRKSPESFALVDELKRWQRGVTYYPLTSDLKGRTYRHPNLRLTFANADGSVDRQIAYGIRLSDRTLSVPQGGLVGDSYSLDVLRGFDLSESDGAENYEPKRALDFARTGSATYIGLAGTLSTATDGRARIGLPYVVRRNLMPDSIKMMSGWTWRGSIGHTYGHQDQFGGTDAILVTGLKASTAADFFAFTGALTTGARYEPSFSIKRVSTTGQLFINNPHGTANGQWRVDLSLLGSDWARLTRTHPAVTILTEFTATASGSGFHFQAVATDVSFYVCGPQLDSGTVSSVYQPTNASGVDITHPVNGAGLVLEGKTTNLLVNPSLTAGSGGLATGWGISGSGAGGFSLSGGVQTFTATTQGSGLKQILAVDLSAGAVTASADIAGLGCAIQISMYSGTDGSTGFLGTVTSTDTVSAASERKTVTASNAAARSVAVRITDNRASGWAPVAFTRPQLEQLSFATSWTDGTRQPDLCGIAYVMNDLKDSHDLTQSRSWVVSGMSQPTKSGDDNTVTFAATTNHIYQAVTPSDTASITRTAAARLKLGTLSGSSLLRLLDQSGNVIATSTISTSSLSASEYRTFYVTGTAAADDTGLRVQLIGNSGTGTVLVRSLGLVQGNHPGLEVRTTDAAIAKPADATLDPAWMQNGKLRGGFVLPSGANVAAGTVILGYSGGILITQFASTITLSCVSNGGTRSVSITLNAADGNKHSFEASRGNYVTSAGVRAMPLTLTVDSTTATIDAAALYGDSSWSTPDQTRLISGGTVNATLSAPSDGRMIDWPTLPAGAIPAV